MIEIFLKLGRDKVREPYGEGFWSDRFRFLDYTEYGGAPLFGVDGVSVICHGASPARAIMNGIRTAADCVSSQFTADMRAALSRMIPEGATWSNFLNRRKVAMLS